MVFATYFHYLSGVFTTYFQKRCRKETTNVGKRKMF